MKHYMVGKARRLLPCVKTWVEFELNFFSQWYSEDTRRVYQGKRGGGRSKKWKFLRVEHYSLVMFSVEKGEHFDQ
jgi:hypothetical protein